MAHRPVPRPDLPDSKESSSGPTPVQPGRLGQTGPDLSVSQWADMLSTRGGGALSTDLALDLVLNEIVQRACAATGAEAAAIALERDGEFACRATTGEIAPDLGSRLSTDSGLSAFCVKTRQVQGCNDSDADPRLDPEVCRHLGVRSMLVVPILKEDVLLGIIEILSSRPGAFGDADILVLQKLSGDVVTSLELAAGTRTEPFPIDAPPAAEVVTPAEESFVPPHLQMAERQARHGWLQASDFWTGALLLAVVGLALILGWAVGRAGQRRATGLESARAQDLQGQSLDAPTSNSPEAGALPAKGNSSTGSGLVVYKEGKVIFQLPPNSASRPQAAPKAVVAPQASGSSPIRIAPQIATEYLVQRVEPDYPLAARQSHIQGDVVLDAVVGDDGQVQRLKTLSGDPQLVTAATEAVRHWRFRPFLRAGQPEGFQTQITVAFRLPQEFQPILKGKD